MRDHISFFVLFYFVLFCFFFIFFLASEALEISILFHPPLRFTSVRLQSSAVLMRVSVPGQAGPSELQPARPPVRDRHKSIALPGLRLRGGRGKPSAPQVSGLQPSGNSKRLTIRRVGAESTEKNKAHSQQKGTFLFFCLENPISSTDTSQARVSPVEFSPIRFFDPVRSHHIQTSTSLVKVHSNPVKPIRRKGQRAERAKRTKEKISTKIQSGQSISSRLDDCSPIQSNPGNNLIKSRNVEEKKTHSTEIR